MNSVVDFCFLVSNLFLAPYRGHFNIVIFFYFNYTIPFKLENNDTQYKKFLNALHRQMEH